MCVCVHTNNSPTTPHSPPPRPLPPQALVITEMMMMIIFISFDHVESEIYPLTKTSKSLETTAKPQQKKKKESYSPQRMKQIESAGIILMNHANTKYIKCTFNKNLLTCQRNLVRKCTFSVE